MLIVTFLSSFIFIVWLPVALVSWFEFGLSSLSSVDDSSLAVLSLPAVFSSAASPDSCLVSLIEVKGEAFICVLELTFVLELTLGEDVLEGGVSAHMRGRNIW